MAESIQAERRGVLLGLVAAGMGVGAGALLPSLARAFMAGPASALLPGEAGKALSVQQVAFVDRVADLVIPRTDTPGASDAGVVGFIDRWLAEYENEAGRSEFLSDLDGLMQRADRFGAGPFLRLNRERQARFVLEEDTAAFAGERPFFRGFKRLVTLGYYSSEPGATLELEYLPVPGPFQGDVPVTEATRNYAT